MVEAILKYQSIVWERGQSMPDYILNDGDTITFVNSDGDHRKFVYSSKALIQTKCEIHPNHECGNCGKYHTSYTLQMESK